MWVDLEMTGLDPVEDFILEVGFRLTDWDGHEEYARFTEKVYQPGWYERLSLGDNRPAFEIHTANGLIEELREGELNGEGCEPREVESLMLEWLDEHGVPDGLSLAGSSNHLDRYFLKRHMPQLANRFGYRLMDVSAIRESMRIANPVLEEAYQAWRATRPADAHRPQEDIDASIAQYQWFIDNYLHI